MRFKYNGHLTFDEKNKVVADEIIKEYPLINYNTAIKIASIEDKINTDISFQMIFKRYYNILLFVRNKKVLFDKVLDDLEYFYNNNYNNKGYTNSLEDRMMVEILNYNKGVRDDFPIINEFY